ncbi:MAG: riboflavin synthase [Burkholderiaceae bacterium]|jgi:riboflavin synthase|nr:riboflavin synthase [Burkholderiaceae bacterium]
MFTGLVQGIARIERVEPIHADGGGVRLTVDAARVAGFAAEVGDSIALNGACMTATRVDGTRFTVDVSRESLLRTAGLDAAGEVNLETSMRLGDKVGGHLVSGHVDGIGHVVSVTPAAESWTLLLRAERDLGRYLAYKGSITVDGVSLTVNRVTDTAQGCEFSINLIPHTWQATTLHRLRAGDRVNLEIDLVARYVERMLSAPKP